MLTVIILTKNEELNIEAAIFNAQKVTEDVLVVDSGSTDNTVKLALKVGARVVRREWDNDFAAQRNFALENTDSDWILYLDADERLNDKLVASIQSVIIQNKVKQYAIRRKSVAFGQEFNYGVLKPDYVYRMFKRDHVKWVNKVHERPICADPKEILDGYARHYTYTDWPMYFGKFNQYTTIWAENAYQNGKRATYLAAFLHGLGGWFQMGVLKLGLLDGWLGLVLTCNHFFYTYIKYVKLIDLQRRGK